MIKICPNCRSTFRLNDTVDIKAPAIQELPCPVCGQKIWQPSGWVLPKRWTVDEVINRYPASGSPPEPQVFEQTVPTEAVKPVWNVEIPDFGELGKIPGNIGAGLKTGAIIAIVLLVLLLVVGMRK